MARRPVERRTRARPPTRNEELSPESHITMSIQQIVMVAFILLTAGSGYAYLVWNQSAATSSIAAINTKIDTVATATTAVSKDQDAKREQMGKDFLASTEKIADKVSDLNTALAVQQSTTKTMADTLTTISNQLGEVLTHAAPATAGHK